MTDTDQAATTAQTSIAALIAQHRSGRTELDINEELRELALAVLSLNKGGSLIVKIDIKPVTDDVHSGVAVAIESTVKPPRPPAPPAVMFIDDDGSVSTANPRRETFPGMDA